MDSYEQERNKFIFKIAKIVGIGLIGLILFFSTFVIVSAGHVGVVTRLGAVNRVAQPGLTIKIPFVEGLKAMETRTQKEQTEADAASKDLQDVSATVALNFHLDPQKAVDVYQNVGVEYKVRIIDPAIQEAFKAATAKFTAEELIVRRSEVKGVVLEELKSRLAHQHIIVDDFNIVSFNFSKAFNEAIEAKTVSGQQALKAENDLRRIEVEAQQKIASAKAEAESIRIRSEALAQNQNLVSWEAIQKWDGKLPTYTGGAIPFININK